MPASSESNCEEAVILVRRFISERHVSYTVLLQGDGYRFNLSSLIGIVLFSPSFNLPAKLTYPSHNKEYQDLDITAKAAPDTRPP
jgi:hypothetical protein